MQEKGRSITRDFTKGELEDMFYNLMAVGKTLTGKVAGTSLDGTMAFALAIVGASFASQLDIMEDSDTLYVEVDDIPSWRKEEL